MSPNSALLLGRTPVKASASACFLPHNLASWSPTSYWYWEEASIQAHRSTWITWGYVLTCSPSLYRVGCMWKISPSGRNQYMCLSYRISIFRPGWMPKCSNEGSLKSLFRSTKRFKRLPDFFNVVSIYFSSCLCIFFPSIWCLCSPKKTFTCHHWCNPSRSRALPNRSFIPLWGHVSLYLFCSMEDRIAYYHCSKPLHISKHKLTSTTGLWNSGEKLSAGPVLPAPKRTALKENSGRNRLQQH